jgi:multiple sugar transport system ATP-binding protein
MAGVQLQGVTKVFDGDVCAVDSVDLDIGDGEFVVLVGPSGCGKSTLLRMIAGLEEVSDGTIRLGGEDVTDVLERDRDIAMVFQNYALYPHMTVRRNLGFALRMKRIPPAERERRVEEAARVLGLEELMERKPAALSGGQRQRVAMGRAMVREPAVFLMDEPLSNLDAKLRVAMRAELARLHERLGVTTIYVTHDQVEAMTLGERVAVLRDGVLQQCADPEELYDRPANLFVAAFIGSPAMNLVAGRLAGGAVAFAGHTLALPDRSPLAGSEREVIIGVRPSDLELPGPWSEPSLPRLTVEVQVVERLGSESNVIFAVNAPRVDTDSTRAAAEAQASDDDQLLAEDDRALFTARLAGRPAIGAGEQLELAVRTERLYLFDPESGRTLSAAGDRARARA